MILWSFWLACGELNWILHQANYRSLAKMIILLTKNASILIVVHAKRDALLEESCMHCLLHEPFVRPNWHDNCRTTPVVCTDRHCKCETKEKPIRITYSVCVLGWPSSRRDTDNQDTKNGRNRYPKSAENRAITRKTISNLINSISDRIGHKWIAQSDVGCMTTLIQHEKCLRMQNMHGQRGMHGEWRLCQSAEAKWRKNI